MNYFKIFILCALFLIKCASNPLSNTLDEWKKVEEQLGSLSSIKARHRNFVRSIVRCAIHVKYDSQGRIAITENLLQYAKIDSNVTVIGMIKKIEIWSPKLLNNNSSNDLIDGDYEDLANEINF